MFRDPLIPKKMGDPRIAYHGTLKSPGQLRGIAQVILCPMGYQDEIGGRKIIQSDGTELIALNMGVDINVPPLFRSALQRWNSPDTAVPLAPRKPPRSGRSGKPGVYSIPARVRARRDFSFKSDSLMMTSR